MDGKTEGLILDGIKSLSNDQKDTKNCISMLDKKVSLHIQKTEYEFEKINALDQQQNEILDKHIEGVNTLKKMYSLQKEDFENRLQQQVEAYKKDLKAHHDRLRSIEKPRETRRYLAKLLSKIGGGISVAAGAIYGVLKLFGIV